MTDKLHCTLFHDTDGMCCRGDEPCGYDEHPSRRKPLPADEMLRINAGIQRQMLGVFLALAFVFGLGAWALATLESQQKQQDLIMQENVR